MNAKYFKFKQHTKFKTRYDLIANVGKYDRLLTPNTRNEITIYFTKPHGIKASLERKANFRIKQNDKHISGVFLIDIENPELAYGDVQNTMDSLLFVIKNETIEIIVLEGLKPFQHNINEEFLNGEYDSMIEELRESVNKN